MLLVSGGVIVFAGRFKIEFGHALDAGFAFGEQSDSASVVERGLGQQCNFGGSAIERRVEGGGGDFLFALFVVVFPARDAGFQRIIFGDLRFHVVVAGYDF